MLEFFLVCSHCWVREEGQEVLSLVPTGHGFTPVRGWGHREQVLAFRVSSASGFFLCLNIYRCLK